MHQSSERTDMRTYGMVNRAIFWDLQGTLGGDEATSIKLIQSALSDDIRLHFTDYESTSHPLFLLYCF